MRLIAFWLLSLSAFAATGDITAVRIVGTGDTRLQGWAAEIDISGLGTGGTYTFGLGTYNVPSVTTPYFTVTSSGYDDTGATTTIERRVYATNAVRKAYPNQASNEETDNTTYVTIRVALDDWIYSSDTLTFTAPANFYSQGGNNSNAATAMSVTNNSTEAYPKVIANWSWPGYSRVTGASFTLRAVAFHRSAQQKRPVRAVKFTCTDQHSHTATATVLEPSIDPAMADAQKVQEYIGSMPLAPFDQGDTLTCNFAAYPWYGDSGSVVDTSDGVNTHPTSLYAPQQYLNDKNDTYGVTYAVVDATSGNNATCAAADIAAAEPTNCQNIYAAANAIAAYNNTNHSRNNVSAGIIYLKEGSHAWTGGTTSAGARADNPAWITVTKWTGTTRANVLIATGATDKYIAKRVKVEDVKLTNSTTGGFDGGQDFLWLHNCDVDTSGAASIYNVDVAYLTQNAYWDTDNTPVQPYSTTNSQRALARGNTWQEVSADAVKFYTVLGNTIKLTGGASVGYDYTSQTIPAFTNSITAFNRIEHTSASNPTIGHLEGTSLSESSGHALIGNVVERISGTSPPILQIAADGSSGTPVNNVLVWHNTLVGQRANLAYNDYINNDVTPPKFRKHWSIIGNLFDDYNCVTDIDPHGGTADNDRVGNHSVIHGVGVRSNTLLNRVGTAGYENKFSGAYWSSGTSVNPNFVNDNSVATDSTGGGDYHLTSSSPGLSFVERGKAVLPYDLDGKPRANNGNGSVGAYEYGSAGQPRRVIRMGGDE